MKEKLTKEKAIQEHRAMWNWIADKCENWNETEYGSFDRNHTDLKHEYLQNHNKGEIEFDCFCCEYNIKNKHSLWCFCCPIDWGNLKELTSHFCLDARIENDDQGLYSLWCDANDHKRAAELARQIANLPEKK